MDNQVFYSAAAAARAVQSFVLEHQDVPELQQKTPEILLSSALAGLAARSTAETLPAQLTIGVFGPSQAGKSHLVSRMAADEGTLEAVIGGEQVDFIKHINPPGGDREATGFITRFTHQKQDEIEGFPLKVRVFNECDIGKILLNSFFNDLDLKAEKPDFSLQRLTSHLTEVEQHWQKDIGEIRADAPAFEDVVSLLQYVLNKSESWLQAVSDPLCPFWQKFCYLMLRLPLEGRAELLSGLWCKAKVFTLYYLYIVREILKFGGREYVYVSLDAFVKKNAQGVRDNSGAQHNLINIRSMERILNGGDDLLPVALDKEHVIELPFACMAAASMEITFPLADGCAVDNFDVLDFPGARTRERRILKNFLDDEVNMPGPDKPTEMMIKDGWEFVRRGKVAYLFDRSSERGELDILLLCISMSNQLEVTEIVSLASGWIEDNAGRTPAERTRLAHNPFYMILTRSDEPLTKELNQAESGAGSNANLFIKTPFERFTGREWLEEWTPGHPFNNCYLVRKPGMNGEWIEREGQHELAIKADKQELLSKICAQIKADKLYQERLHQPDKALDAMLTLNDGGISFVASELCAEFKDKAAHDERLVRRCHPALQRLIDLLSPFAFFGGQAEMAKAEKQGMYVAESLLQCDGRVRILGMLREALELSDERLSAAYDAVYSVGPNAAQYSRRVCSLYAENVSALSHSPFAEAMKSQLTDFLTGFARGSVDFDENTVKKSAFFFTPEGVLKARDVFARDFTELLELFSDLLLKIFRAEPLQVEQMLTKRLTETEHASSVSDAERAVQSHQAALFMSDFTSQLCFKSVEKLSGSTIKRRFGFSPDGLYLLPEAERTEEVFALSPPEDEYLPQLSDTVTYAQRLWADYFSTFIFALKQLSASGQSKGAFSAEVNDQLCAIVNQLKAAAGE